MSSTRVARAAWLAGVVGLAGAANAQLSQGPDVVYQDMTTTSVYGPVGTIRAYSLGSHTCNRGNQNLLWTNNATPGLAMNLYRIHGGRITQIGQSFVKTACCAAVSNGCGLGCNGASGSVLGVGCLDVYSSGWNAGQSRLAPRSGINPWTGQFSPIPSDSHNAINRRLQVQTADLLDSNFPGAVYIAEGVYIATDEHNVNNNQNKLNNASHRRVAINQSTFAMGFPAGSVMQVAKPAIFSWADHGNGANSPDIRVVVNPLDVPSEGRFYVAHKASDNGDGTWRYEYAVFNQNSHEAAGTWRIPVDSSTTVTNVGFYAVPYHSGEPYDNSPWVATVSGGAVVWSSPQTFAQNPNTNALRWGTMYNFWFDADQPPVAGTAQLGLFRSPLIALGTAVAVPDVGGGCAADWNDDGEVNSNDISAYLTAWLADVQNGTTVADFNDDGVTNSNDISAFLTAWLDAVANGC